MTAAALGAALTDSGALVAGALSEAADRFTLLLYKNY
jgi:hypothetical protein